MGTSHNELMNTNFKSVAMWVRKAMELVYNQHLCRWKTPTSRSLTADVQVALEDLVLGAPGSPASPDLKDLIIVTGVGNNSPGVFPGRLVVENVASRWWVRTVRPLAFFWFYQFHQHYPHKGKWRLYHHRSYFIWQDAAMPRCDATDPA